MATDTLIDWDKAYATRTSGMHASEIRELLKVIEQPEIISFAGGIPDPKLFPTQVVRDTYAQILSEPQPGPHPLQYSASEGYLPLRNWITGYMARLGVPCEIDNIVITSGSQQGLDLLGKLLLSPGDTALVEAPTYLGALQAFNAYEPRYGILSLGQADGSPAASVATPATPGSREAFAYVVPDFANPTGETLSEAVRLKLLDLVAERGIPLLEDAAYAGLRFEGEPVAPCLALDIRRCGHIDRSRVIYCGTFSKTISPGMRVGWICAARPLVQKVVLAKQAGDLHTATLNQIVMHEVAETIYPTQVATLIPSYKGRRDAMLRALAQHMPAGTHWTKPQGGMFVWVTLPIGINGAKLLAAALHEEQVAFVPGGAFFANGGGANTIRLNYSLPSEAAIDEGIARLGRLITRQLAS